MDSLLVLLSASLVGYKIVKSKQERHIELVPALDPTDPIYEAVGAAPPAEIVPTQPPPPPTATPPPTPSQPGIPAFLLNTRPPTMSLPQVAEIPIARLKAVDDDGTGVQEFTDQFFPQDSKSTGQSVTKSPWMRAIEVSQNAPFKTEREEAHPSQEHDKDDIRGRNIPAVLRERDAHQATKTVSKSKKFESPVTQEWTANGENRGLHPIKRYHKFLLSDQPVVELPEGPRGNFASGAGRSSSGPNLNNNKRELHVNHTGVPSASFAVGMPEASFKLDASNAERWEVDAHVASASRAPVDSGSNTALINQSFTLAHDESMDLLAVADRSNLFYSSLPLSTVDSGSNTARIKESFTLAHDEGLDLLAVTDKSGLSRKLLPPSAVDVEGEAALVKDAFTAAHDGGLDLLAVKENCNLSKTHLPPSDGDSGGKAALVKESFTLAHDGSLDLYAVTDNCNMSKTHLPPSAGESGSKAALMKESFTLPHDRSLDLGAVTKHSNVSKTNFPPSEAPVVADMRMSERGVATPSVVGATGGVVQKHTDKNSEIKSVSHKENLAALTQRLSIASGKKASKPSAVRKASDHEHAEGTLAEEESGYKVRGKPHTHKAADVSKFAKPDSGKTVNQFSLGNSKDSINATPLTSKNFTAPQPDNLPSFLRVAPTASVSLAQKELSLKPSSGGLSDLVSMGRNRTVPNVKTANLSEKEPEQKETKLRTVVMNRTNKGVVVANPYNRPRPTISEN